MIGCAGSDVFGFSVGISGNTTIVGADMRPGLTLGGVLGLVLLATWANAAEPGPRCALLGQMAVSSCLDMVGSLAADDNEADDRALGRLADLTTSYQALACDPLPLAAAMDCLLDGSGSAPPRELARSCIDASGLVAAE